MQTLGQQGDGLGIDVLEEECREYRYRSETHAREEAAEGELKGIAQPVGAGGGGAHRGAGRRLRQSLATILQLKRLLTGKKRWPP